MSKIEKLLEKIKNRNAAVSYSELKNLLGNLGYIEYTKGKASGSRVAFVNKESKHEILLHKPHGKDLKDYQKEQVKIALQEKGYL